MCKKTKVRSSFYDQESAKRQNLVLFSEVVLDRTKCLPITNASHMLVNEDLWRQTSSELICWTGPACFQWQILKIYKDQKVRKCEEVKNKWKAKNLFNPILGKSTFSVKRNSYTITRCLYPLLHSPNADVHFLYYIKIKKLFCTILIKVRVKSLTGIYTPPKIKYK